MRKTGYAALAFTAALAVGCSRSNTAGTTANGTAGTAGTSGSGAVSSDVNFVRDVSDLNQREIDLSRLALEHSSNPEIKQFAQMTIDDHTKAGDKLNALVAQASIDTTASKSDVGKDQSEQEKLGQKQGADFDRGYLDAIIDGHDTFIRKLGSRVEKSGSGDAVTVSPEKSDNPTTQSLNQWAADTYPAASSHREKAKELKDTLKKNGTE